MTISCKIWWIIITASALNDVVVAICIVTKDSTTRYENRLDCSGRYRCETIQRIIERGPIEYSCSNTSIAEINTYSQGKSNIENRMFIKDSYLYSLTPNIFTWKNTTELHIEYTNTSEIIPGFFSKFDSLMVLEITNNKLQTVIDGVFSALTTLTHLNLSSNSITDLTLHSFSGLLHLKILDLSKNKIVSISSPVFDNLNFLTYVDISQNLLKNVSNIFNKTSLETIRLSNNQLNEFNFEQLKYNYDLRQVDLSKNKIKSINVIGNITNLNLSYNRLESFNSMSNITNLNLSHNCLKTINNSMLNSYTKILDLSYNNISIIFESSLEDLEGNNVLEYLYLDHNNIKLLTRESLKELKNLKHLDLSFNRINQIQFGIFNNLNELIYLDMSSNNMLLDFPTLTTLKSLEVLKIQNNKILNFETNVLVSRFKNLNFVSLGNNLWKCSELASIIHVLQTNNITVSLGNNTKINNINGISCKDNNDLKEESIIINRNNETISQENIEYKTYNENLLNNTFRKFLDFFNQQFLTKNLSTSANNIDQNTFIQYLNQNFTHTNFYNYMENLKQFENRTSSFSQMIHFFGEGFNQTNFYKYLNSFKFSPVSNISNNVVTSKATSTLNQTVLLLTTINKTFFNMSENLQKVLISLRAREDNFSNTFQQNNTSEFVGINKFESQALVDNNFKDGKMIRNNFIFTNMLLVLIVSGIGVYLYYSFWKLKNVNTNIQEEVQLM